MQYALQVFKSEDHFDFRTFMRDGEPWFVLADVCRLLGIKNPSDAASRLDDDERMTLALTEGQSGVRGGPRAMNVISESGLYALITRSDKAEAKRFRKWVTAEVLPRIRKTGGYGKTSPALPRFFHRYCINQSRVDRGYFSVIGVLAVHVYGRLEFEGHLMADNAPDGTENRPDVAVGRRFSEWLEKNHPEVKDAFSYYIHWTPQKEVEARQYPLDMYGLFVTFLDEVWVPEFSSTYFKTRDPAALAYLPKLLPAPDKARPGMMRRPTLRRASR